MNAQRYLVAIGSNMRVPGIGPPRAVLRRALETLDGAGARLIAASPVIDSVPVGPSPRRFANAAGVFETAKLPEAFLDTLQALEVRFGRRRLGQRWQARPLDLDIVLWSGGEFTSRRLVVPHPLWRSRPFVTGPAARVAANWRDPATGLTVARIHARLTRPRPTPSAARGRVGP